MAQYRKMFTVASVARFVSGAVAYWFIAFWIFVFFAIGLMGDCFDDVACNASKDAYARFVLTIPPFALMSYLGIAGYLVRRRWLRVKKFNQNSLAELAFH